MGEQRPRSTSEPQTEPETELDHTDGEGAMMVERATVDMCGNASFVLNTREEWINCMVLGEDDPTPLHVMERGTCAQLGGSLDGEAYSCLGVWMYVGQAMEEGELEERDAEEMRMFWMDKCCTFDDKSMEEAGCNADHQVMMSHEEVGDLKMKGWLLRPCA